MGASSWEYYVPYQADISVALQKLCESVYLEVAQKYPTRIERIAQLEDDIKHLDGLYPHSQTDAHQAELRESHADDLLYSLKRLRALPEPTTIQEKIYELHIICEPDGTGTILDMRGIANEPSYFEIAPLSEKKLVDILGTSQPTRELIEIKKIKRAIIEHQRSQMGSYIIVYKNGQPDEIYFVGFSGD